MADNDIPEDASENPTPPSRRPIAQQMAGGPKDSLDASIAAQADAPIVPLDAVTAARMANKDRLTDTTSYGPPPTRAPIPEQSPSPPDPSLAEKIGSSIQRLKNKNQ